jgi:type I restriction enzyme R subunit
VRAKEDVITEARNPLFWDKATIADLERIRVELRGIMHLRQPSASTTLPPKVIDVAEDDALIERKTHTVKLEGLELAAYRDRVEKVLRNLFDLNPILQRIRAGEPVNEDDLRTLTSLVLTQDPTLDLTDLLDYYPETAGHLDLAIRQIIGLDGQAVRRRFEHFAQTHPALTAQQVRFLDMLQNHIAHYGSITVERLYEAPFTTLHSDGLDGIFTDERTAQELLDIIETFTAAKPQGGASQ